MQRDRFDKFTERARKVLALAQQEATRLGHHYIGTEHLLLGLLYEGDGVGARVLEGLGITLERAREAVEERIGRGDRVIPGEIGLTPRAKKVIELAVEEARRLGHHYIGTEHLLLGLIREGDGVAATVLQNLGADLDMARHNTIQVLSQTPPDRAVEPDQPLISRGESQPLDDELRALLQTLTPESRQVLALAHQEAQLFRHTYIGTEHLLLGLVRQDEGLAAAVLRGLGADPDRVRSAAEFIIGKGDRMVVGEAGLTHRARRVLAFGQEEARRLGAQRVAPEHILLGLVREADGLASGVLDSLGVSLQKVRAQTILLLDRGGINADTPNERPLAQGNVPSAPPSGQAIARPPWEYLILHVGNSEDGRRMVLAVNGEDTSLLGSGVTYLYDGLQTLGRDGWELVSIDRLPEGDALYIFKRCPINASYVPPA